MRNFVIINGVNSNTINGLGINELPPITKPEMRNIREEIDGRDGDITTNLGYSAYDKTITIGLFGTGYDINNIVAFFNGEGTIVFSNEPDKYYNFKILNQIDYESLQKFKTASITFHCQPFKYPLTETPLEIEYDYIEQEAETLTLNNTGNALMKLNPKGNTSQSGTPTPTSPIPVSVVSGDNEVKIFGKNIYDFLNNTYTKEPHLTITKLDNGYTITNSGSGNERILFQNVSVDSAKTYVLSFEINNPSGARTEVGWVGSSKTILSTATSGRLSSALTGITTSAFSMYVGANATITFTNIMICEGNDTSTTYEPYQSQTYEVDLPVENIATSYMGSGNGYYNYNYDNSKVSKTMTLSFMPNFSATNTTVYARPSTDGTLYTLGNIPTITSGKKASLTFTLTDAQISEIKATTGGFFQIYDPDVVFTESYVSEVQLEPGTKANHYTPYNTTPIELCKIGTYQDYFTKNSDGQWCKYNAIGKVVLDGSETWSTRTSSSATHVKFKNENAFTYDVKDRLQLLSNYFVPNGGANDAAYSGNAICGNVGQYAKWLHVSIDNTIASDVASFKTWLGTHNLSVYYILNTPYLSLIEDNNLIEQLNELENAMSYEGTTNIGQVNNDNGFIISAKALEQGTNEVVINNIGNVYSKPLIALEGSGNVDIYLDNTQILKANVESKMNIDIAQLEAYNPDTMTLLNRQVIGNYNSMTLQPGNNTIRIDGALDKATITNYTRWL